MATPDFYDIELASNPGFLSALKHLVLHRLLDLDPWEVLTTEERVRERSQGVNSRYPQRTVICFAERQDTDDVACLVLASNSETSSGQVIVVHDFADSGSEVDATFPDLWGWFSMAVSDMIDSFHRSNL